MSEIPKFQDSTPQVTVTGQTADPVSFEQFRSAEKNLSDDTILGIMNNELEVVPGEKAFMIKNWLDQVPSDENDARFAQDPERVIGFRDQLSNFVADNLKIRFNPQQIGEDGKSYLKTIKSRFLSKLEEDKEVVGEFVRGVHRDEKPKYPTSAYEFRGMDIQTQDGSKFDLLSEAVGKIRTNITIQREIAGLFIHYSSSNYVEARQRGEKPELTRRIYLNPSIESSVDIFQQIVTAADQAGITMKGKILDRSQEVIGPRRKKEAGEFGLRGDAIVLYAGEDADTLLSLVEAVYKDNATEFHGRSVSKIPLRIAEGAGIGDEPDEGSLTSHRAELLERVKAKTAARLGAKDFNSPEAITEFRKVYEELASAAGVSTRNIAFNAA